MAIQVSRLIDKGERYALAGKVDMARKAFRRALKIEPHDAEGLNSLARLELDSNNPKGAISPLRTLAGLYSKEPEIRLRLASALEDSGDRDQAEEVLRALVAEYPDFAAGYNNLGNLLQISHNFDAALEAYDRALKLQPEVAEIWVNAGNMLEDLDRAADAVERYTTAKELDPRSSEASYYRARARTTLGEPEAAMADVEECLAIDPADQNGLALKGVLLSCLGRHEEERALFDYDRFVRTFKPEPPEGYATIEDFNADLIQHIRRRTQLEYDPESSSTRGGWHSGNLLADPHDVTAALRALLQGVFQVYVSELPTDASHPFLNRDHGKVRLNAQAQILENQGYLVTHIHPRGWISSAYYLAIPDVVSQASESPDDDNPGWLEFGVPTEDIKTSVELETRRVQPEPGLAVIFPSYFFHGTRPFESDAPRISVGVDLIA